MRNGSPNCLSRDGAEGDRITCPGKRLELHALAVGRRGDHFVAALVDAHVIHVAARVARFVEEHQVTRLRMAMAHPLELEELVLRGALNALAMTGVTVDVLGEAGAVES